MADDQPRDEFASLPVDSDLGETVEEQPRSARVLRAGELALIFVGGTVGTAARALVDIALPPVEGIPVATLTVNLTGAFVIGVLLDLLARTGEDTGWRRRLRLLCGTGFLGGYTTYSALALETVTATPVLSVLYSVGSVVLGASLALLGIVAARAFVKRQAG